MSASTSEPRSVIEAQSTVQIPRVAIRFCTQCKWNLRAAYYAQELLQTFGTTIGEISLIPVTGGIFEITLIHASTINTAASDDNTSSSDASGVMTPTSTSSETTIAVSDISGIKTPTKITTRTAPDTSSGSIQSTLIWDRKLDRGFPETKELKNRIRNIIDPQRDMGHIDRSLKKGTSAGHTGVDPKVTSSSLEDDKTKSGKIRTSTLEVVPVAAQGTRVAVDTNGAAGTSDSTNTNDAADTSGPTGTGTVSNTSNAADTSGSTDTSGPADPSGSGQGVRDCEDCK